MDPDQMKHISLLLVEDEAEFRNTLAKRLLKRGLHSLQAPDGETCLAMLAKQPVDVVVMDVMMPEMNGYDVCVVVKADPELKRIPIVLLTAIDQAMFKTTYTLHMGLMTEADDYIAKPLEAKELVRRVDDLLGKGS